MASPGDHRILKNRPVLRIICAGRWNRTAQCRLNGLPRERQSNAPNSPALIPVQQPVGIDWVIRTANRSVDPVESAHVHRHVIHTISLRAEHMVRWIHSASLRSAIGFPVAAQPCKSILFLRALCDKALHSFNRKQIEVCTAQFFAARVGAGVQDPDPIFIVGLPRSGSTLPNGDLPKPRRSGAITRVRCPSASI